MLLNYVCKSVSASDGTSLRTNVDTMPRPQALRGNSKTLYREDVYSLPPPQVHARKKPAPLLPTPPPLRTFCEFSERQGSLPVFAEKHHPRPVSETLVSVALVTRHAVFWSVCVLPASSDFRPNQVHTQKGGSPPPSGLTMVGQQLLPVAPLLVPSRCLMGQSDF